jgi:hypothetical protein
MRLYDTFVNCKWVASRWQLYSTHLHTNSTQNDKNKQYINNELNTKCLKTYLHSWHEFLLGSRLDSIMEIL